MRTTGSYMKKQPFREREMKLDAHDMNKDMKSLVRVKDVEALRVSQPTKWSLK